MSARGFSGPFAAQIEGFLSFKESVGIKSGSRDSTLRDFDRWCSETGATEFDRGTVEGWVLDMKGRRSPDHLSWMSHIRELGRWMAANGDPGAYVLSGDFRAKAVRVEPYLVTQAEADAFFDAARAVEAPPPWGWQSVAYFGLMACCGLRTCEVRRLAVSDVDLSAGTVDVRWSKGNRSRLLPVGGQMAGELAACGARSDASFGPGRAAFFVTGSGGPVTPGASAARFRRIWREAGNPGSKGGRTPRAYDFRHRFAYANLERWGREGVDVMAMLPYLSRYMGHATLDSTLYYVHTSPDFLAGFSASVSSASSVLPEVGFDG